MRHSPASRQCSNIPACRVLPLKGTAWSLIWPSQTLFLWSQTFSTLWIYPGVMGQMKRAESHWRCSQVSLWLPAGLCWEMSLIPIIVCLFHGALEWELWGGWPHKQLSHNHFSSAPLQMALGADNTLEHGTELGVCVVQLNCLRHIRPTWCAHPIQVPFQRTPQSSPGALSSLFNCLFR